MKKRVSITLFFILVVSVVGCSGQAESTDPSPTIPPEPASPTASEIVDKQRTVRLNRQTVLLGGIEPHRWMM